MAVRRYLPAFIGGEDKTWYFYHSDDDGPLDLTGSTLSAEIIWDDCVRITLTEDDGLTVINLAPAAAPDYEDPDDANWHYSLTLTDSQTEDIPVGKGEVALVLIREIDDVTSKRGPLYLERTI